ncbi:hypothetical protein EYF80_042736 [Liparis tanakae]|uniref:Uncharacterized protein n=1 Tax=Liparis tanakae TaxID=230148 RepID=A0A4Z2G3D9_9TELE|nr:hypothetical protein EYF80_042736 [Liparis tanakae]
MQTSSRKRSQEHRLTHRSKVAHTAKSPYPVGQKAAPRRGSRQLTRISVPAQVELLDHVPVAVPHVGRPCQQEVVGRLPHGLEGQRHSRGSENLLVPRTDSRGLGGLGAHLVVQQPVLVPVGRLVGLHLRARHAGQLLGQLPPPEGHLHRRGQQHEVQQQAGHQALAIYNSTTPWLVLGNSNPGEDEGVGCTASPAFKRLQAVLIMEQGSEPGASSRDHRETTHRHMSSIPL